MIEARHPMKKIPQTEELATLLFLHSQTVITGQILKVDGGLSSSAPAVIAESKRFPTSHRLVPQGYNIQDNPCLFAGWNP